MTDLLLRETSSYDAILFWLMNRGNSIFSESFYSLPSAELLQATHTPTVGRSAGAEKVKEGVGRVSENAEGANGIKDNTEDANRVNESAEDANTIRDNAEDCNRLNESAEGANGIKDNTEDANRVNESAEDANTIRDNAEDCNRLNESAEDAEAKADIEFVYFLHQLFQKMIVAHPPQRDFVDCVSGYITEDNTVSEDDLTSALESYFGVDDDNDDIEFFSTLHDVVELSASLFHDDSVALFTSLDP